MKVRNLHCGKSIARTPLVKVLEILKNFFQEVFKQGLGQSPKVFPALIPLDGIGRETSGMGSIKPAAQNPHCVKPVSKTPLVKVLEILKNFFQEVFKWGSGQSPEVFPKVFYAL